MSLNGFRRRVAVRHVDDVEVLERVGRPVCYLEPFVEHAGKPPRWVVGLRDSRICPARLSQPVRIPPLKAPRACGVRKIVTGVMSSIS